MSFFDNLRAKLNPASDDPDERLRAVLREQGDDGTKPRPVDHGACFNNQSDADAFTGYVTEQGFAIKDAEEEYCVAFTRESAVVGEEFGALLATLREKADEMHGQYDGWGCPVVRQQ